MKNLLPNFLRIMSCDNGGTEKVIDKMTRPSGIDYNALVGDMKQYMASRDIDGDSGEYSYESGIYVFFVDYRIRQSRVEYSCPMLFREGTEIPCPWTAIYFDYDAQIEIN